MFSLETSEEPCYYIALRVAPLWVSFSAKSEKLKVERRLLIAVLKLTSIRITTSFSLPIFFQLGVSEVLQATV